MAKKYKMSTDIPADITTPDKIETRLGTLNFFDGLPDEATVEKMYDNLDFMRGVEVFLNTPLGQANKSLQANWQARFYINRIKPAKAHSSGVTSANLVNRLNSSVELSALRRKPLLQRTSMTPPR